MNYSTYFPVVHFFARFHYTFLLFIYGYCVLHVYVINKSNNLRISETLINYLFLVSSVSSSLSSSSHQPVN